MPFFLYGFILFIVIAWALQAWDVYQIKLINPLGNFFANRGQLIWIAFSFWLLLFLFLSGRLTHTSLLPPQPVITESFADSPPSPSPNSQDILCGCPTAFPREQRFSDGKTFTVGVKGSYFYPLPLRCGLPVGTCSQPLPPEFPPPKPSWGEATGGLSPPPSKTVPKRTLKRWPPTQRDKTGFGPRSFWCIQNQTYSKNNPTDFYQSLPPTECVRYTEDPFRPWKNQCGRESTFSQVPLPVYRSQQECELARKPCAGLSYDQCIQTERCGWCQDRSGQGECLPGTPEGPQDLTRSCSPNLPTPAGAWIPGEANPYIGLELNEEESKKKKKAAEEWIWNPESQPGQGEVLTPLTPNENLWSRFRQEMTPPGINKFISPSHR